MRGLPPPGFLVGRCLGALVQSGCRCAVAVAVALVGRYWLAAVVAVAVLVVVSGCCAASVGGVVLVRR